MSGTAKKVALITGANKGIGLETARQLGKLDVTVLIGARDLAKGEAAAAELKKEGAKEAPAIRKSAALALIQPVWVRSGIAGCWTDEMSNRGDEQRPTHWAVLRGAGEPALSGGIQPWLFRLSGLADIAHRAMFTSRTPVQWILVQPALFPHLLCRPVI